MKFEREIRILAGKIPCRLCVLKGVDHIESDGGCRHRPLVDSDLTDQEVLIRLQRVVEFYHDK